jgi:hypothetical protein
MRKGFQILALVIFCVIVAYMPNVLGNESYGEDLDNIIDNMGLDQSIPIAVVVLILGLVLIAMQKKCEEIKPLGGQPTLMSGGAVEGAGGGILYQ